MLNSFKAEVTLFEETNFTTRGLGLDIKFGVLQFTTDFTSRLFCKDIYMNTCVMTKLKFEHKLLIDF